jgi:hypothetical protein
VVRISCLRIGFRTGTGIGGIMGLASTGVTDGVLHLHSTYSLTTHQNNPGNPAVSQNSPANAVNYSATTECSTSSKARDADRVSLNDTLENGSSAAGEDCSSCVNCRKSSCSTSSFSILEGHGVRSSDFLPGCSGVSQYCSSCLQQMYGEDSLHVDCCCNGNSGERRLNSPNSRAGYCDEPLFVDRACQVEYDDISEQTQNHYPCVNGVSVTSDNTSQISSQEPSCSVSRNNGERVDRRTADTRKWRQPSKCKVSTADKATSTSDPVLEEDFVQVRVR